MNDHLRSLLSLRHAPEASGFARIPEDARVTDLGIEYKVRYCDRNGVVLRRMDETNATISFTQAEIHEKLNRSKNPMQVKPRFYTQANATARTRGADELSCLNPGDQEDVIRKEFFVRSFLRKRHEYREKCRRARRDGVRLPDVAVSRSPEPMRRVVAEIALEWRDLQRRGTTSSPTYRNKKGQELYLPSNSAVKGWIQLMEKNEFNPICLKNNYRTDRPEHFSADELVFLKEALEQACSTTRPNIADIHRTMVAKIEKANEGKPEQERLRIPNVDTLRNRYNDVPAMYRHLGRHGKDSARREWQPEFGGIDCVRALERVEFDDHETDLQALLVETKVWQTLSKAEKAQVKRVRLWISAMIDVASRSVISLHASAQPPSIRSAMTALEMATRDKTEAARRLGCASPWDQHGTMETLAVDSAAYFAHRPFRVAVNDAGIDLFLPPAGEAPFRGFIERWFQTFSTQMFAFFTGRTWGSIAKKGDYDSEGHASAIADQVGECLIRWLVDGYHNTPHSELNGATPRDRWLELSRDYGVMPGPKGALRTHLFGTLIERVITKKGMRVVGLQFQSKQLQQIRRKVGKTPVMARMNNHNLFSISVWWENGWIEVPCVHGELAGVSIWQWLAASERLRLFHAENAKTSRETMLATFAWLKEQAEMARLEAGIVSPILTDEDYLRFERKMDRVFELVDSPITGELRPEGEWHPSDDLFAVLNIQPIVYAKAAKAEKAAAKAVKEAAEAGGRPIVGGPAPKRNGESAAFPAPEPDEAVVQRVSNIFGDE